MPRPGRRRIGGLALASLAFGLGLGLATLWNFGSEDSVHDQVPSRASNGPGREVSVPERGGASDSVPTSDQPTANRGRSSEASGTESVPDPTEIGSGSEESASEGESGRGRHDSIEVPLTGPLPANRESPAEENGADQIPDPSVTEPDREDELSEAEGGRDSDDSIEVRPERSQDSSVQPWIRDWDALGELRDPGFADTAQAYIARYGTVPGASVWVAKAEGLLAELRELEAESPTQREAGETWMNSLGMEFVWVPAGKFLMGSPMDQEVRFRDERQHGVGISEGYWMKKYEVTQGEWEAVIGTNPSHFSSCGPRCPVEQVSWEDAQEFVRRLNSRESGRGYSYRLPTEAEWEYAARAGSTGARYGGLDAIAWYRVNSDSKPHPVGQKRANVWGLHDMLGNVSEWAGDWYGEYPSGTVTDPEGPGAGSGRVVRGGGWYGSAVYVRSASRFGLSPGARNNSFGFRLVRTE